MHFDNNPQLARLAGGFQPGRGNLSRDALSRYSLRADQLPNNFGDNRSKTAGMPQVAGPEIMVPHLLEAAQLRRIPAQHATGPGMMALIKRLGSVPQQMAKTLGTSNPKEQAMQLLKMGVRRGI